MNKLPPTTKAPQERFTKDKEPSTWTGGTEKKSSSGLWKVVLCRKHSPIRDNYIPNITVLKPTFHTSLQMLFEMEQLGIRQLCILFKKSYHFSTSLTYYLSKGNGISKSEEMVVTWHVVFHVKISKALKLHCSMECSSSKSGSSHSRDSSRNTGQRRG